MFATYRRTQWSAIYAVVTKLLSILCVVLPVIFYKADVNVAVFGFTVASVLTCVIGLSVMYVPFRGVRHRAASVSLKEIFTFSLPLMFAGFWGIAEKAADQFFISRWFGEVVFADFANGSMELPFVGMVLSAGAVVLLPLFSKMVAGHSEQQEIIELWRRSAVKAAYILYPLVAFSWFYADVIMTFLYGSKYEASGTYFRIMLTINFFTIAQYYPILLALGKTRLYSNVLMIAAIAVWAFEYLSVTIFANPYLISVVAIVIRILRIIFFLHVIAGILGSGVKALIPFKELLKLFISSMACAFVSYMAISHMHFIDYRIWQLIIGFGIFSIILIGSSFFIGIDYLSILRPLVTRCCVKLSKKLSVVWLPDLSEIIRLLSNPTMKTAAHLII